MTTCSVDAQCASGLLCNANGECVAPAPPDAGPDAGPDGGVDAGTGGAPGTGGATATGGSTGTGGATQDGGIDAGRDAGPPGDKVGSKLEGACACRVPGGTGTSGTPALLTALGLLGIALRRRDRRENRHAA